jgi:hypothetical protein
LRKKQGRRQIVRPFMHAQVRVVSAAAAAACPRLRSAIALAASTEPSSAA